MYVSEIACDLIDVNISWISHRLPSNAPLRAAGILCSATIRLAEQYGMRTSPIRLQNLWHNKPKNTLVTDCASYAHDCCVAVEAH